MHQAKSLTVSLNDCKLLHVDINLQERFVTNLVCNVAAIAGHGAHTE
jgi:hypothetical protein